ncbi:hypothetical protein GCM10023322_17510 [Rugosimonospora acidiphila]|uniref:Uncharacterized protein n=1 Tax=Rugosimonospora acidiphila TaxID=556531 RepID=A0ABP9RNW8_9ACTN
MTGLITMDEAPLPTGLARRVRRRATTQTSRRIAEPAAFPAVCPARSGDAPGAIGPVVAACRRRRATQSTMDGTIAGLGDLAAGANPDHDQCAATRVPWVRVHCGLVCPGVAFRPAFTP